MFPIYIDRKGQASFAQPMPRLRFGSTEMDIAGQRIRIGEVATQAAIALAPYFWTGMRCRLIEAEAR